MIEALFSLVMVIVEAITAIFTAIIGGISGLILGAGETIAALDLLALLFVFIVELLFWLVLGVKELFSAVLNRRPVKRVARPVIWRPKSKKVNIDKKTK